MKLVTLEVGGQTFTCRVGVVPRLDYAVLIGRDCPLLAHLLKNSQRNPKASVHQGLQAEPERVELPLHRIDLAQLTRDDASLRFALQEALLEPLPQKRLTSTSLWTVASCIGG